MSKIDTTQFDAMLDINDPQFASKLKAVLDLKDGDTLEFITPQFERTDGRKPRSGPPLFNFDALPSLADAALKELGCCRWDEPDEAGNVLWLYPQEWYDAIPDGHIVHDIGGSAEPFKHGETDDDRRYGCLAFGFLRPASTTPEREP